MRKIELQEYKCIVANIMFKIDRICRDNGITYMLFYGTLLGAVRHKGFIPWDDDIDIIMTRDNYNKFVNIIRDIGEENGLNFISIETNPKTIYIHAKVCDSRTTLYEKNFRHVDGYGAFVDIFQMDYIPDNIEERTKYCKKYQRIGRLIAHSARTGFEGNGSKWLYVKRLMAFILSKPFNTSKIISKITNEFVKNDEKQTKYIGLPWGLSNAVFPAKFFEKTTEIEFEGQKLLAPENPDQVLTQLYGDYMTWPEEKDRVSNHILDCYIND